MCGILVFLEGVAIGPLGVLDATDEKLQEGGQVEAIGHWFMPSWPRSIHLVAFVASHSTLLTRWTLHSPAQNDAQEAMMSNCSSHEEPVIQDDSEHGLTMDNFAEGLGARGPDTQGVARVSITPLLSCRRPVLSVPCVAPSSRVTLV